MSFNFQEDTDTIILEDKTVFCKRQNKKTNFRLKLTNQDLDDGVMVNFPYEGIYFSNKGLTTGIPLCQRFFRSGVIPFVTINDTRYFCMGVDANHGTLTDFGGAVKKYETFARAGCRELYEESLGIFKVGPKTLYNYSVSVYDKNMIIMFVEFKVNSIEKLVFEFHKRYSKVSKSENSSMMWIDENTFCNLIRTGKSLNDKNYIYPAIYKPVGDLLRSVCRSNGFF